MNSCICKITQSFPFQQLFNLIDLDLSENLINFIYESSFSGLANLKKLSLSSNKIFSIYKTSFRGLDKLEFIYLESNRLKHFKQSIIKDLKNLKKVCLFNNYLSEVECKISDCILVSDQSCDDEFHLYYNKQFSNQIIILNGNINFTNSTINF